MKRDLFEFAWIYVIVFWIVSADNPISFGLKLRLFAGCFIVMGSVYCGVKALARVMRSSMNSG